MREIYKLYKVSCEEWDFDEYDSFVVSAKSEEEALEVVHSRNNTRNFRTYNTRIIMIAETTIFKESLIIISSFNSK